MRLALDAATKEATRRLDDFYPHLEALDASPPTPWCRRVAT
ncbi:hypothetical protein MBRU_07605 [Mycolicibacterium brumae DSM 44177]|nr:hypothetical protein MBRU_07605 [Mycolicibacterium brumae DSM 44177]